MIQRQIAAKGRLVFLLALGVSGCGRPNAPAMSPRIDQKVSPPASGMAQVIFVRPATGCDTYDHAVVVDEEGKFVANLVGGTANAVQVGAGQHAFFVWPGMDLRRQGAPKNYRLVSVLDRRWEADTSSVVLLNVPTPWQGRGQCFRYNVFDFQTPPANLGAESLEAVRLVDSDVAAGEAYLRERNELSTAYFEMAREVLELKRKKRATEQTPVRSPY